MEPESDGVVTLGTTLEVEVLSCGRPDPTRVEFFKDDRLLAPLMTEERVEVVNVYVTVQDRRGEYATGLEVQDFRLTEEAVPQSITNFGVEDLNLNVAFVLDASYSMEGLKLETARAALESVAGHLTFPRDQAMLIGIQTLPVIKVEWTRDKVGLLAGLEDLEASGSTALYDSILVAAMVKRSDVMVYCVGLGRSLDRLYDLYADKPLAKILSGFSDETGAGPSSLEECRTCKAPSIASWTTCGTSHPMPRGMEAGERFEST